MKHKPGSRRRCSRTKAASFTCLILKGHRTAHRASLAAYFTQIERLKENPETRLLSLMTEAGFAGPKKVSRRAMLLAFCRWGTDDGRAW